MDDDTPFNSSNGEDSNVTIIIIKEVQEKSNKNYNNDLYNHLLKIIQKKRKLKQIKKK